MTYVIKNSEFKSHTLNKKGYVKMHDKVKAFDVLLNILKKNISPSREFSLCIAKLEEASFFAARAIALDEKNQKENAVSVDEVAPPEPNPELKLVKSTTLRLKTT